MKKVGTRGRCINTASIPESQGAHEISKGKAPGNVSCRRIERRTGNRCGVRRTFTAAHRTPRWSSDLIRQVDQSQRHFSLHLFYCKLCRSPGYGARLCFWPATSQPRARVTEMTTLDGQQTPTSPCPSLVARISASVERPPLRPFAPLHRRSGTRLAHCSSPPRASALTWAARRPDHEPE